MLFGHPASVPPLVVVFELGTMVMVMVTVMVASAGRARARRWLLWSLSPALHPSEVWLALDSKSALAVSLHPGKPWQV